MAGHQADDGPGAPPPAPGPSLISGAIGRSLADTLQAQCRQQLDDLWRGVLAGLPDD